MSKLQFPARARSTIEFYDALTPDQRRAMALAGIESMCVMGAMRSWDEGIAAAAKPFMEIIDGVDDLQMAPRWESLSEAVADRGGNLVGLTGQAECGKSTVAKRMVSEHGYVRASFADGLRAGLLALDPLVPDTGSSTVRLGELVERIGWDAAKSHAGGEVRRLMQRFGTEAGWMMHGTCLWVDQAMHAACAAGAPVVFDDARFPHEFAAIRARGGVLVRVERPGAARKIAAAAAAHLSENSAAGEQVDHTLLNDDSLARLQAQVDMLVERIR